MIRVKNKVSDEDFQQPLIQLDFVRHKKPLIRRLAGLDTIKDRV
jgi:hypothetical protein